MILWSALLACGGADSSLTAAPSLTEDPTIDGTDLVLHAFPSVSVLDDGTTRALPVVLRDPSFDERPVISLLRPFQLLGSVTGRTTVPLARTSLPGLDTPIDALVDLDAEATEVSVRVGSTADEGFSASVVEGPHVVTVLPDSPLLGILAFATDLSTNGPDLDLTVDQGVPVWGQITDGGLARPGTLVRLRTDRGLLGASTRTDDDGWFEVRSAVGMSVQVVAEGDDGITPTLVAAPTLVTEQGARVDLRYSPTPPSTLSLRVVGPGGDGQRLMPYRLRSVALEGYGPEATVVQTGFADTSGNIVTQAVQGSYILELLVQGDTALSGREVVVEIDGPTSLGTVTLDRLEPLMGRLDDGTTDVGAATVTCIERGLARRRWSTIADDTGRFTMDVPTSALTCVVLPPEDRRDLASLRFQVDDLQQPVELTLTAGRLLTGTVVLEGDPEPLALLEVRDENGVLVGTDLTNASGEYAIRVQP